MANVAPSDPVLTSVEMHLATPAAPVEGVVVSTERCTAARTKSSSIVRHVAIDVSGTALEGRFKAGQSFGVLPPGVDASGKAHKLRLYSIACGSAGEDGRGRVLSTTVKRLVDEHQETHKLFLGVASNYLCDLQVGERLKVTGPSGKRFVLPAEPAKHDYVLIATGTGIAPFRGMIADLVAGGMGAGSRVALVLGAAYASDLLYHSHFEGLARGGGNEWFTYLTAVSREKQADGQGPLYVQDRLRTHRELLGSMLASPRTLVYICGLAGMELGILQRMAEILPASDLEGYMQVDAEVRGSPGAWTRTMLHKQVRPTRRVFLEVY